MSTATATAAADTSRSAPQPQTWKYWLTQRPAGPGTCPDDGLLETSGFDVRTFVPVIGRDAWAYAVYDRQLSEEEIAGYELTPDVREWFPVRVTRWKRSSPRFGEIEAVVLPVLVQGTAPQDRCDNLDDRAVLWKFCCSAEEAEQTRRKYSGD